MVLYVQTGRFGTHADTDLQVKGDGSVNLALLKRLIHLLENFPAVAEGYERAARVDLKKGTVIFAHTMVSEGSRTPFLVLSLAEALNMSIDDLRAKVEAA